MKDRFDIEHCRVQRPYSKFEYVGRFLWACAGPLFRWSPRPFFAWRRFLLRLFGAEVGANAHVYPSARVYLPWMLTLGEEASIGEWALIYNLGRVVIGDQATISHRAHLCAGTHDYQSPALPLLRESIVIGPRVWVCADAFVGPGVAVGEGSIVGAGAVLTKDADPWSVLIGNPAKLLKKRRMAVGSGQMS